MALPPVGWVIWDELTAMEGLVLEVLVPSVTLVAVMVKLPLALKVKLNVFVPALSAALAGSVAEESLLVILIVSVAVVTRFQLPSTPLTVTMKDAPAV